MRHWRESEYAQTSEYTMLYPTKEILSIDLNDIINRLTKIKLKYSDSKIKFVAMGYSPMVAAVSFVLHKVNAGRSNAQSIDIVYFEVEDGELIEKPIASYKEDVKEVDN